MQLPPQRVAGVTKRVATCCQIHFLVHIFRAPFTSNPDPCPVVVLTPVLRHLGIITGHSSGPHLRPAETQLESRPLREMDRAARNPVTALSRRLDLEDQIPSKFWCELTFGFETGQGSSEFW